MLQNAYLLAKIGADTAENEQHLAEILPKTPASSAPRRARRASAAKKLSAVPDPVLVVTTATFESAVF